jgi:RNA polymerase sigma factor (sigma-70 family)
MLNFEDADAFNRFITEHQRKVFNLVLNRVQHAQDAEEITQDVFVDVYRTATNFRGEASISTWLYRITINKCIDHLRKRQQKKYKLFGGSLQNNTNPDDGPKDFYHPGIAAENKERAAVLFKAMKQLPEKQHTAWVLSELENLAYKDISEIMNVSLSSVESLLFRARQNLRKTLAALYEQ